jgi:hypothetical protein
MTRTISAHASSHGCKETKRTGPYSRSSESCSRHVVDLIHALDLDGMRATIRKLYRAHYAPFAPHIFAGANPTESREE